MTKEELAAKLNGISKSEYKGKLSGYAVKSIESGRSSYPVSNLIEYCKGTGLRIFMVDLAMDEVFEIEKTMDIHKVIGILMERYEISPNTILQKADVHYTPPQKGRISFSINTLLGICSVLHCRIDFKN